MLALINRKSILSYLEAELYLFLSTMKRTLLLFTALVLVSTTYLCTPCSSQDVGSDSKGGGVFTVYSLKVVRAEINTKDPLTFSHSFARDTTTFVNVSTRELTVRKVHGVTARLALTNSGKNVILSNLLDTKLGLEARVGHQVIVDSVKSLFGIRGLFGLSGTYSTGINGILGFDNFSYYNQETNNVSHERPLNFGAEYNYNYYITPKSKYRTTKSGKTKEAIRFTIAFNSSLLRTWNNEELKNYQDLDKSVITQTAVAFDKFNGRYGILDKSFWKGRFSAALPIYIDHINAIPFCATYITSSGTKVSPGLNINYVVSPIKWYVYKFPTSLGGGIDWFDKKLNRPNLFVRGAFTL